ncbi:hypothetical protein LIER_42851 [Lithospermum erythrorhizon]|uniref:Uncharacterized protein n=1 Tax=Lithospermum erythrorhizon TaxID=34254 RepID=A0AAV3P230_LITER
MGKIIVGLTVIIHSYMITMNIKLNLADSRKVELSLQGCNWRGKLERSLFDMVSYLDTDVFGSFKQAEHRTLGYFQTHNWKKKNIFWELPYWPKLKIKHKIDFMHNEKNNGENYFFTTMDVKGNTKDTESSREDLEAHTYRTSLFVTRKNGKSPKPNASYTLTRKQQQVVPTLLRKLKRPDGFATKFARSSSSAKFTGFKSHDMHIIVQILIPVAFRHLLPKPILETLTESCHFFRDISSSTLQADQVRRLGRNIV